MGRYSGLASALSVVAERLKSQREAGEEMRGKKELLGSEEAMRVRLLEKEAELSPKEWKPKTQEEALTFKKTKSGVSSWDIQKEARTTVNAMINQNPVLQAQVFQNPKSVTDLIDKEVERLSGKYMEKQGTTFPLAEPTVPITTPTIAQPTFTPPKIPAPDLTQERIKVIDPATKQKGTIPKSQWEQAKQAGYKRIP